MATNKDLINLIDLSLGVEPQGVVNFNYLHGLMHGIVKRLVDLESRPAHLRKGKGKDLTGMEAGEGEEEDVDAQLSKDSARRSRGDSRLSKDSAQVSRGDGRLSKDGAQVSKDGAGVSKGDGQLSKDGSGVSRDDAKDGAGVSRGDAKDGAGISRGDAKDGAGISRGDAKDGAGVSRGDAKDGAGVSRGDAKDGAGVSRGDAKDGAGVSRGDAKDGASDARDGVARVSRGDGQLSKDGAGQLPTDDAKPSRGDDDGQLPRYASGGSGGSGFVSSSPKQGSRASIRQYSSHSRSRPASLVSAANDLGALERKLQELEQRMTSIETLPEMLERVAADAGATPVSDMWNFNLLNKRLTATEEGVGKTSKLVDELLAEINDLKSRISESNEQGKRLSVQVSGEIDTIHDKLKNLERLKLAAASSGSQDTLGDAAVALMGDMDTKIDKMQSEIKSLKSQLSESDLSAASAVSAVLKEQRELIDKNESLLMAQNESLSEVEKSMSESANAVDTMNGRVGTLEEELNKILAMTGEMQTSLRDKVNASDITSLMPTSTGDSEGASNLLPKMLELQTKINGLEAQVGAVPQDMQDQVAALRNTVDMQSGDIASLSNLVRALEAKQSSESPGKFDDFGSQLAQLRERLNELDRAVTALSDHLANLSHQDTETVTETDGEKLVDLNSFNVVQGLLGQLQQEHERLMGTAAHLSHELDVNKEHVKSLYDSMDDVKQNKADRTQVEVEVREKADRKALEDKASREWVDSTFEKLDKEIREARSKMMGQEEALKLAVNQLSEDVEGKLDRMELQPLKDYFEKKFDSAKVLPKVQSAREAIVDDAAGIKKPLRFACLSCDKPVEMKQLGIVPTLPSITTFPGTRTFRPYTTYELEMIRKHQKLLYPLPPIMDMHRAARSAGGTHTLTRPHQRFRLAPYGGPSALITPEPYINNMTSRSSPLVYEETDIVGQDGHVYKGRVTRKNKPPAGFRRKGPTRPLTSPHQPTSYI